MRIIRIVGPFLIQALATVQRSMTSFHQPILLAHDTITFTDALGRTHYLPFIFFQDYEVRKVPLATLFFHLLTWIQVLKRSLRAAFRNLPGEARVNCGRYVLHNMQTKQVVKKSTWTQTVFPGAKVGMSMLITEYPIDIGYCPRLTCRFPFPYQPKKYEAAFKW